MNRRKFFASIFGTLVIATIAKSIPIEKWEFAKVWNKRLKGIFFTKGDKCLAIYRDRSGNAITYWSNMKKQRLPFAIALPYCGQFYIQKSIWKGSKEDTMFKEQLSCFRSRV